MKIRFTEDRWLKSEDRTEVPRFKKGSTHDLSVDSAFRWVRRNVAVYVVEEAVVEVKLDRPMMGGTVKGGGGLMGEPRVIGSHPVASASDFKPKKAKRKPATQNLAPPFVESDKPIMGVVGGKLKRKPKGE